MAAVAENGAKASLFQDLKLKRRRLQDLMSVNSETYRNDSSCAVEADLQSNTCAESSENGYGSQSVAGRKTRKTEDFCGKEINIRATGNSMLYTPPPYRSGLEAGLQSNTCAESSENGYGSQSVAGRKTLKTEDFCEKEKNIRATGNSMLYTPPPYRSGLEAGLQSNTCAESSENGYGSQSVAGRKTLKTEDFCEKEKNIRATGNSMLYTPPPYRSGLEAGLQSNTCAESSENGYGSQSVAGRKTLKTEDFCEKEKNIRATGNSMLYTPPPYRSGLEAGLQSNTCAESSENGYGSQSVAGRKTLKTEDFCEKEKNIRATGNSMLYTPPPYRSGLEAGLQSNTCAESSENGYGSQSVAGRKTRKTEDFCGKEKKFRATGTMLYTPPPYRNDLVNGMYLGVAYVGLPPGLCENGENGGKETLGLGSQFLQNSLKVGLVPMSAPISGLLPMASMGLSGLSSYCDQNTKAQPLFLTTMPGGFRVTSTGPVPIAPSGGTPKQGSASNKRAYQNSANFSGTDDDVESRASSEPPFNP